MLLLTVLLAAAAPSVETTPAAKPATGEKMICKTETPTGSRLPGKRVCKTASQMAREAELTQQLIRDNQTGRAIN